MAFAAAVGNSGLKLAQASSGHDVLRGARLGDGGLAVNFGPQNPQFHQVRLFQKQHSGSRDQTKHQQLLTNNKIVTNILL
jgi:hypothetical protein